MPRSTIVSLSVAVVFFSVFANASALLTSREANFMLGDNTASKPLAFTENKGQFGEKTLFRAEAGGAVIYICCDEVAYLFARDTDKEVEEDSPKPAKHGLPNYPRHEKECLLVKARFVGTNTDAAVSGFDRLPYNYNYFYGNDPSGWQTDVPNFSSVVYADIYPGIYLKYYGDENSLKYDFIVSPGADISQIAIKYEGVEELGVSNAGDLEAQTTFGPVFEKAPYIYQEIDGIKREIAGRYELKGDGLFGFALDDYNPAYPLVIDPELVFSTYLGDTGADFAYAIDTDLNGNIFITGSTNSYTFPVVNPYQGSRNGNFNDVFVSKFSNSGCCLLYSTYLGGTNHDEAMAMQVSQNGVAYLVGSTNSLDYPVANAFQPSSAGWPDVFVTAISSSGNNLVYSTYLGGNAVEEGLGIAIDNQQTIYVTGITFSNNFPVFNSLYNTAAGGGDAFITKLRPDGSSPLFSTYFGGSSEDRGFDIEIDREQNIYICGTTSSSEFPVTSSFDPAYSGNGDGFVSKISSSGDSLLYSTFLGGNAYDQCFVMAIDSMLCIHAGGSTYSHDFPLKNAFQPDFRVIFDAFVTKFSPSGDSLIYSTLLGEQNSTQALEIDIDGCAWVAGSTPSSNFPLVDPYCPTFGGHYDAFLTKFNLTGDSLLYSTFWGGNNLDDLADIAIDTLGKIYITGYTMSSNLPVLNPYDGSHNGGADIFLAKFGPTYPCAYVIGDVNGNGTANGIDVGYMVNFLKGGSAPPNNCECPPFGQIFLAADVNGNCAVNGIDVSYLVNYYKGGPALHYCPDCPPAP